MSLGPRQRRTTKFKRQIDGWTGVAVDALLEVPMSSQKFKPGRPSLRGRMIGRKARNGGSDSSTLDDWSSSISLRLSAHLPHTKS